MKRGDRRSVYSQRLKKAVSALENAEQYAVWIGREEDASDIRASLLALERIRKTLLKSKEPE
jgi:hypothetical protein